MVKLNNTQLRRNLRNPLCGNRYLRLRGGWDPAGQVRGSLRCHHVTGRPTPSWGFNFCMCVTIFCVSCLLKKFLGRSLHLPLFLPPYLCTAINKYSSPDNAPQSVNCRLKGQFGLNRQQGYYRVNGKRPRKVRPVNLAPIVIPRQVVVVYNTTNSEELTGHLDAVLLCARDLT